MSSKESVALTVKGLTVDVTSSGLPIVDDIDVEVRANEVLGVVGESGSGKTTTALAILGYASAGAAISAGEITIDGHAVHDMSEKELRQFRGRHIAYVPQNSGRSLNPAFRISTSFADIAHSATGTAEDEITRGLAAVDLPAGRDFQRRMPHQLSGGQQQRVTIAMALSGDPSVVVMDEPTTGLDVVTQASVIDEIRRLRESRDMAIVYVSHDLAVISQLADRIAVMYAGRIVEEGPAAAVLARPLHPYTLGLVEATPDHTRPSRLVPMPGTVVEIGDRPPGCSFVDRCAQSTATCATIEPALTPVSDGRTVACHHADTTPAVREPVPLALTDRVQAEPVLEVRGLSASHRGRGESVIAATDIDLELFPGECVALVGESGSGKTTISRSLIGLKVPDSGTIRFKGELVPARARRRTLAQRQGIQYVFQDPFDSLNPRRSVGDELMHTIRALRRQSRRDAGQEIFELLDRVRLPKVVADRRPHQLSGGERQRVAIARALASRPDVMVCDEITSALDVSVQAAVLEVLTDLRKELGLAMLLITHDLGVVSVAADRLLVLRDGRICESGSVNDVMTSPQDQYTRRLVSAAPSLSAMSQSRGGPVTGIGPVSS